MLQILQQELYLQNNRTKSLKTYSSVGTHISTGSTSHNLLHIVICTTSNALLSIAVWPTPNVLLCIQLILLKNIMIIVVNKTW